MRCLIFLFLLITVTSAKETFFYAVKPTLLFRVNEEDKDYRPGFGVIGTFMAKLSKKLAFGIEPEYIVWSLKFEDESVTYNIHSISSSVFVRPIFQIKEKLKLYFDIAAGPNFLVTSYGKQGFSHVNNNYLNCILGSSIGCNISNFDLSFNSGFFKEKEINETFIWIGFSIGATW